MNDQMQHQVEMSFGMELFCSGLNCVDENVRVYLVVCKIKERNIEKKI